MVTPLQERWTTVPFKSNPLVPPCLLIPLKSTVNTNITRVCRLSVPFAETQPPPHSMTVVGCNF
ncbi:hypothetical protein BCR42DRAFT_428335 [Absidia repens]|uniref:Uncharacterized protein n=1 Tax=Absidia repens TaxID=90262 RepID=A0A1X2HYU2_9FUNG|nr:hypothetical protein BCR42DRAFT_428335 [Absidia repens]